MTAARAYSYMRFSTPEQEKGDSRRRQTDAAARWLRDNPGYVLDTELNMFDKGVSGWRGKNLDAAACLGAFLRAIEAGDVPRGSVLLVERLDRISREYPLDAANTIARIIRGGVDVVRLEGNQRYDEKTIRGDIGALLTMIIEFAVGNQESEKKSKRVAEAWAAKRAGKAASGYGRNANLLTKIVPTWIHVTDDGKRVLKPKEAAVVRRIFKLAAEGVGQHSITKTLESENVPTFGRSKHWQKSYVFKLLRSSTVIGTLTPGTAAGGKRTPQAPIEGYYPAAIERELFERVQTLLTTTHRGRTGPTTLKVQNVLAGLAKCPRCGGAMTRVYKGTAAKAGTPKLVCAWAKVGGACAYVGVPLPVIEHALQRQARAPLPEADSDLREQLKHRRAELDGIEDAIEELLGSIEHGATKALALRLKAREEQRDRLAVELAALEKQAEDSDSKLFKRRAARYRAAMAAHPFDVAAANLALREMVTKVVVDYDRQTLRMHWRHDGESEIAYAM